MCLEPIKIKNPYKGLTKLGFNRLHDCTAAYIYVPCGHCPECLHRKQSDIVQRIQVELFSHHAFFFTLTYDNDHLPSIRVVEREVPNKETGELETHADTFTYADMSHVVNMFKRIRNHNLFGVPFKYVVVSERGSKRHRPHFHGIIFVPKASADKFHLTALEWQISAVLRECWAINVGTRKNPKYESLFTYHCRVTPDGVKTNFDCHYLNPIASDKGEEDVAFYVTKYIFKQSDWEDKFHSYIYFNYPRCHKYIWDIIKSRRQNSLGLGLDSDYEEPFSKCNISSEAFSHIQSHLVSDKPFPTFANPITGRLTPLALYYKKNGFVFNPFDGFELYNRYNIPDTDWCHLDISAPLADDVRRKATKYFKQCDNISIHEDSNFD